MISQKQVLAGLMGGCLALALLSGVGVPSAQAAGLTYIGGRIKTIHRNADGTVLMSNSTRWRNDQGHILEDTRYETVKKRTIGRKARGMLFPRSPASAAIMAALLAAGYIFDDDNEEILDNVEDEDVLDPEATGKGVCWRGGNGWASSGSASYTLAECLVVISTAWAGDRPLKTKTNWSTGLTCPGGGACVATDMVSPGNYGHARSWARSVSNPGIIGFWALPISTDEEEQVRDEMKERDPLTDEQIGDAIVRNGAYKGLIRRLFEDPRTGLLKPDPPAPAEDHDGFDAIANDSGNDISNKLNDLPEDPPVADWDTGTDNVVEQDANGDPVFDGKFGPGMGLLPSAGDGTNSQHGGTGTGTGTNPDTGDYASDEELRRDATRGATREEGDHAPDAGDTAGAEDIPLTEDGEAVKVRLDCTGVNVLACMSLSSDEYIGSTDLPVEWIPVEFEQSMVCPSLAVVPGIDWTDGEEWFCDALEASRPVTLALASFIALSILSFGVMRAD